MEPKYYRAMKESRVSVEGQGSVRLYVGEYLVEPVPGDVYVSGLFGVRSCERAVGSRLEMFYSLVDDGSVIEVPKPIRKQEWFFREVVRHLEYSLAHLNGRIERVEKDLQMYYAGTLAVSPMHHVLWDIQKSRTCYVVAISGVKKQIGDLFEMSLDEWESFVFEGDFLDRTRVEEYAGWLVRNAARRFGIEFY